jgi:Flp pilus assembly protein TadB
MADQGFQMLFIPEVMIALSPYYFEGLHKIMIAIGLVVVVVVLVVIRIVMTRRRARRSDRTPTPPR